MKRGPLQWLQNVLIGADETGNAVLAGDGHHTISARTGKALVKGKAWANVVAGPVINALLFNPRHCIEAALSEGLITPSQAADYWARRAGA